MDVDKEVVEDGLTIQGKTQKFTLWDRRSKEKHLGRWTKLVKKITKEAWIMLATQDSKSLAKQNKCWRKEQTWKRLWQFQRKHEWIKTKKVPLLQSGGALGAQLWNIKTIGENSITQWKAPRS